MHKGHHGHHHHHDDEREHGSTEDLRKLLAMLEHWIDHGDSHIESYREWAGTASAAGEEEVSREIHLAIGDSESVKTHLKRARSIVAGELGLKK